MKLNNLLLSKVIMVACDYVQKETLNTKKHFSNLSCDILSYIDFRGVFDASEKYIEFYNDNKKIVDDYKSFFNYDYDLINIIDSLLCDMMGHVIYAYGIEFDMYYRQCEFFCMSESMKNNLALISFKYNINDLIYELILK